MAWEQGSLFDRLDPTHCALQEWQYTSTFMKLEEWLKVAECGRGFTGNATCKVCPYNEGA